MTARGLLVAAAVAVLAGLGLVISPSGAASEPSGASEPSAAPSEPSGAAAEPSGAAAEPSGATLNGVLQIEGTVSDDRPTSVTVRVTNDRAEPLAGVRLRLAVHDQTRSRYALAQAVDARQPGPVRNAVESGARELDPDASADLRLRASAADLGLAGASPGVYPATVSVLDEHGTAAEFVTALVVPPAGGEPIRLSVFLELQGPVAMRSDGRYEAAALEASAARALRLADALALPLPVTVAIDGRTVEELRGLAEGGLPGAAGADISDRGAEALEALGVVADRAETETVAHPYGPADLVAITRAGLAGEAGSLIDRGQAVIDGLSEGRAVTSSVVVPARGLDASTAGWLSGRAGGTVLNEGQLGLDPTRDMPATPSAVRSLAGIPGLAVAVPDPLLSNLLSRTPAGLDPALAAQRVLAESAAVFFERPGGETPRGLLLAPSPGEAAHLLPALAERLDEAVWLQAVPLSGLLGQVPADPRPETLAYRMPHRDAELPASYVRAIHQARQRLDPLASVLGDEAVAGQDRHLDTALSVGFRGAPLRRHGERLAATIQGQAARLQEAVTVVEGPPLTLTGREGTVPVTLVNNDEDELSVRVRVVTNRYEVEDEGGRDLVLPPGREITTTFDVRAHVPGGTYPVAVEVTAPGGRMALAAGQVAVRSTAASVAGLVVTGGAALFLVASLVHGLVRRRRRGGRDPGGTEDLAASGTEAAATGSPR